ncbi:MAG: T9SS type A sorting domain-containing protein [Bacteroidetes bacterium]|nr:T9SS type A sorting domain-containing protein [Bacteroidota bacterium]
MKKIFFIFLATLSVAKHSQAQITFQKAYGGTAYDVGYSAQETNDSGFIITGGIRSFGAGNEDVYLIKISSDGTLQWTKTFGGTNNDDGYSIQQTNDEGFIIAGTTTSFGAGNNDFYLLKVASDGTPQWTKTFGGAGDDFCSSVQKTNDGGFILIGTTKSFGLINEDIYIIKTSSNGSLEWAKTFGGTYPDYGYSVSQTNDGGFIASGETVSYGIGYGDAYLIKMTSDGNLQWSKTFGESSTNDLGNSIQQTNDGGFIIGGTTSPPSSGNGDVYLIKTDSDGTLQWSKTFGGTKPDYGKSILQANDGGFFIGGYTSSFGGGPHNFYLVKTISDGTLSWSKTFGGSVDDEGFSFQKTNDGGLVITGWTNSFGVGSYDLYLIKTDSNGNSGCNETNPNTITTTPTILTTNPATQVSSGGIIGNLAAQTGSGGIETTLCFTNGVNDFQNSKSEINIFPNPFSTEATIEVSSFKSQVPSSKLEFKLYDVFGREVRRLLFTDNRLLITRGNLASGIYFYKFSDSTEVIGTGKIIIE